MTAPTLRRSARLIPALAALLLLAGCSELSWHVVSPATEQGQRNLRFLLSGLWMTLSISLTAMALSTALGLLVALPALSTRRWLRMLNRVYVEVVRAVPILVLLLWMYYGLPVVAGLAIGAFWAGVLALAISDSAFQAEIFRAGVQSVPKGQVEAAKALALPWGATMRLVILPQAIRRILPALGNQFVYVLKMSSLVSVIGMQELTRKANELVVSEYRPLEIYTILVLEYLALVLIVSAGVRWMERKLAISD